MQVPALIAQLQGIMPEILHVPVLDAQDALIVIGQLLPSYLGEEMPAKGHLSPRLADGGLPVSLPDIILTP